MSLQESLLEFALPRITLALAHHGKDVIAARQVSHSWHAAVRDHFRRGLLDDLRVELEIDVFIASLSAANPEKEDSADKDDFDARHEPQKNFPRKQLLSPQKGGEVLCCAFSPCGKYVSLSTVNQRSQICIIDVRTGELHITCIGHRGAIQTVQYGPCGRQLVTSSLDGTARIWNSATGVEDVTLYSQSGSLFDAEFSPCGLRILTTSFSGEATLFDANTGDELIRMRGHASVVVSGEFSFDGSYILTVSKDGSAQIWMAETGERIRVLAITGRKVRSAGFEPGTVSRVVTVFECGLLVCWEVMAGLELQRWSDQQIGQFAYSPDGQHVIASTRDYRVLLLSLVDFGSNDRFEVLLESETYEVQSVGFSPCGRFLLAASAGVTGTVRLWDFERRSEELCAHQVVPGTVGGVNRIAFSPNGSSLFVATYSGAAFLWGRPAF